MKLTELTFKELEALKSRNKYRRKKGLPELPFEELVAIHPLGRGPGRTTGLGRKTPEEIAERKRLYKQKWGKENRGKKNAANKRYKVAKLKACPKWADLKAIEALYTEAAELTKKTGIEYHVDHIVPLQNELVCGLHVFHNLQILTGKENISKGNRIWPDMPD